MKGKYAFISGLKEPYCSFVKQQNPTKIDECISICREYDNIQAQINYKTFLRQNLSRKNIPKPPMNNHQNSRPNPHQNNISNRNNFNSNNNSFRNPINFPHRRPYQPYIPNNNFQQPRGNEFRPQNNSNNFELMEISSRNTLIQFSECSPIAKC